MGIWRKHNENNEDQFSSFEKPSIQFMDMVNAYLYGDLDTDILYESPIRIGNTWINAFPTTVHVFN